MESLIEQFLIEKRYNDGLSVSTVKAYRLYFSYVTEPLDLEDASTMTTRAFRTLLATLWSSRNWKPVTYNTARKIYRTYCAYLVREKILASNPFDDLWKMNEPQTPRKSLTSQNAVNLRYLLPKLFDLSEFVGFRNYAIFMTFLYTWLRRAELLDLLPTDYDPLSSSLLVRKWKMGKSRMVPVPDQLSPILSDYFDLLAKFSSVSRFFPSRNGNPLTPRNLRNVFDAVRDKIGCPLSPHRLRHTFATELVRNDFDIFNVASVLGHSSVRTTQIYLTADPARIGRKISQVSLYT